MKNGTRNWLVRAPGDIERIEACYFGAAFAAHRHDTYAIGVTPNGVESFDYRGTTRHSLPGQLVILHPDERHDGRAGDENAFRYRTAYIAPADIQSVLGGWSLPFVADAVSEDRRLQAPVRALLEDYHQPLGQLEYEDLLFELATALLVVAGFSKRISSVNRAAARCARDYIDARLNSSFSLRDLERAAQHDRWQLSRDFRALFGTSPHRYLIARRLDEARRLLARGGLIGDVAFACGFSDQSHFGRLFKKAYGLTPKTWVKLATHNHSIPAQAD